MPSFLLRERYLSSDDTKLNLRILAAKSAHQGIFYMPNNHTTWPFMTAVDFPHHENPSTWAGVEPATLGADGQRQTNYATQSALAELPFFFCFNLEGEKDFNDDHREITDFAQSIPGFQECDEDVETWMACDAEDCGFKILNDDEIMTPVQEESDPVDDED
ncbi:uncharacterized protein TNCV_3127651 [Trichonephila clavipes]|nr:uncharacterized protein TNCV_3127651 [Trichonephila clavipes]